jgi:hypothetical protein
MALRRILGTDQAFSVKSDMNSSPDDELLSATWDLSKIDSLSSFLREDSRRVAKLSSLIPHIMTGLVGVVECISVSNATDDSKASRTLRRIRVLLLQISQKLPIVSWLLEFLSCSFNLRFGAVYSFSGVSESPDRLLTFCVLYDELPLLFGAKEPWPSLALSEYLLDECQFCFTLSEASSAIPFIDLQAAQPSSIRDVSWTAGILVHPLPCRLSRSTGIIHVELTPMDYLVRCIIQGESPVVIPRENIEISEQLIRAFGGELELVRSRAAKGDFRAVFAKPLPLDSWVGYILQPSLGYDFWGTLWRYLLKNAAVMNEARPILENIFDFLRERRSYRALFDIQNRLDLREDAILTITEMADCHESWTERVALMSRLESLINREMADRRSGKRPQKISDTTLSKFLQIATIMRDFSTDCRRWGIDFDPKLNVFRSDVAIEPMTFFSLFNREFALALKISSLKPSALDLVVRKLVEMLSCGGSGETQRYLREMGEKLNGPDYERLASQFVVAAAEKLRKADVAQFITGTVKGNDLQVKLLIRFGLLKQAKAVCENPKLITLIYNAALEQRDQQTAEECRRLLPK